MCLNRLQIAKCGSGKTRWEAIAGDKVRDDDGITEEGVRKSQPGSIWEVELIEHADGGEKERHLGRLYSQSLNHQMDAGCQLLRWRTAREQRFSWRQRGACPHFGFVHAVFQVPVGHAAGAAQVQNWIYWSKTQERAELAI